jgi:predicted nucleotidyltransferase component of viral defense system
MFDPRYEAQVRLLLQCLPLLRGQSDFALKGGTAINLFVESMPRVSVDIDLTYLPLKPRTETLAAIDAGLRDLKHEMVQRIPNVTVEEQRSSGQVVRLQVAGPETSIKIEPNLIFRGSVYPPEEKDLCAKAQQHFQASVRVQTLNVADLYGGKLCAALDRQHPRDLYDIALLLNDLGITPDIRRAFVVYLAGHNRPMSELLQPRLKDVSALYDEQFAGMTDREMSLGELAVVQAELPTLLRHALDDDERAFLISLKRGTPKWNRLGIEHIAQLPSLQWKLLNIRRMEKEKHLEALGKLQEVLSS